MYYNRVFSVKILCNFPPELFEQIFAKIFYIYMYIIKKERVKLFNVINFLNTYKINGTQKIGIITVFLQLIWQV